MAQKKNIPFNGKDSLSTRKNSKDTYVHAAGKVNDLQAKATQILDSLRILVVKIVKFLDNGKQ